MSAFTAVFLADMQIGMYATFSGMDDDQIATYAGAGLRVWKTPKVSGMEWDARQYEKAVAMVNRMRPDLVLVGGDMIDDPNVEDQVDAFLRITHTIDPDLPVRWAPGNHDIAADTVVPTAASIAAYREVFGPDYFVFDAGPLTFLVMNTVVADHPEEVPAEWAAQLAFIDDALTTRRPERPVVVVGHHPLFLTTADEQDTYWNIPAAQRRPLIDRFHTAGVPLMLAAHWHRNNIARSDGLEVVASGPVGYPLGDDPSGIRVLTCDDRGLFHRYEPLT